VFSVGYELSRQDPISPALSITHKVVHNYGTKCVFSTEHQAPFVSIKPKFAQILWGFYRNEKNGLYIYHQIDLMSTIYWVHHPKRKLVDLKRQTN
jgi:hypothetical protein